MPDPINLQVLTTDAGLNKILSADTAGLKLSITHIALGDGAYTPTRARTALQHEVVRVPIASSKLNATAHQLDISAAAQGSEAFWVREIGFFDASGTLVFVWSHPTQALGYKSAPSRFLLGLSMIVTEVPLGALQIVDQGQPLELSLAPIQAEVKTLAAVEAWQSEAQAEVLRGLGQSGMFLMRQYTYGGDEPFNRPFTEQFNPAAIHNHPNYVGMPGTAEVSAIINGYYVRTRHNDYRLRGPAAVGSAWLATQEVMAPAVPASVAGSVDAQIDAMRDLFAQYQSGGWPAGFGWTLSYLECWMEEFTENVTDTFDSFRHQQYVATVGEALRETLKYARGGYKNPSENVSFEPPLIHWIDSSGNSRVARLRYRIAAVDVSALGDLRPQLKAVDDWAYAAGFGKPSGRFRVKENANAPGVLDQIMAMVPGLDGAAANLAETYGTVTLKEHGSSAVANAAYYHRFNNGAADATNRTNFRRGYNDPTLWSALTTRPEVAAMAQSGQIYRFSWAIPFELILRTPLERWNPYLIPEVSALTGAGTEANPYTGWKSDAYNYRTPATFFGAELSFTDPADTGAQAAYMRDPGGVARQCRASGIYVALPNIPGIGQIRLRHPIYPVYHEGSHAHAQLAAMRRDLEVTRGIAAGALDLAGMASKGIQSIRGHWIQEGEATLRNRGVVAGCAVAKGAARALNLSAGKCFIGGRIYLVDTLDAAAIVPDNAGAVAATAYAYLTPHADGTYHLAVTALAGSVPDSGIEIYRLIIPAGNTAASDAALASVTLADTRRIEANFPRVLDAPPEASVVLKLLRSNDYRLDIDVVSAVGAPCDARQIVTASRATNGFILRLASAADQVVVRWRVSKINH